MTRRLPAVLAIAMSATLGACVAPTPAPPTLDGHTYLSTGIQGATLVAGTQVRLTFADGSLTASGGCNIMGGAYSIDGDRLTAGQMFMTEMACDAARQRQDEWLARFLGNVRLALAGDTLTMSDGAVTLTLLDQEIATPDEPLEGTRWSSTGS